MAIPTTLDRYENAIPYFNALMEKFISESGEKKVELGTRLDNIINFVDSRSPEQCGNPDHTSSWRDEYEHPMLCY